MKNSMFVIALSIILTMIVFSGCQENNNNTNISSDVFFLSEDLQLLEFVNGSLDITKDEEGIITGVEVLFRFKNLLDKAIKNLSIDIAFCNKNNIVLYNYTFEYNILPAGYTEFLPNRSRQFSGGNVADFDHVNIRIIEYEIVE